MSYPKFSEFAKDDKRLEGPKKRIDEVLNIDLLVTGYRIGKSQYTNKNKDPNAKYLILQIERSAKRFKAKIRHIEKNYLKMSPQSIVSSVMSYVGWIHFCNGYNLERKYVAENDKIQFILNNATEALHQ